MKWAVMAVCVGLAGAAGCASLIGNTRIEASVKVDEQAVNASLDAAAARVEAELKSRGISVVVSPGIDSVRLDAVTRSGDKFAVLLTRVRAADGKEQTKVRIEWEKAPDRNLWLALLAAIAIEAAETPH
jgi:hypothetical protein